MADGPADKDVVISRSRDGSVVHVRVRPRSSRRGVLGVVDGALAIGVGSPPEEGKATDETLRRLAVWLGLARSRLTVETGAAARAKRILVAGVTPEELRRRVADGLARRPQERPRRSRTTGR